MKIAIPRNRPAFTLAALLFAACAWTFLATPPMAHASSDVKTVHADDLVYRGGYYDYEVEAVGFTAKSYKWYMKYGEGSGWTYNHSLDHILDGEEDPEWFSGFNTNHLRLCTNNWKEDSDFDDWGAFKLYCVVTDVNGKKHYSDDFRMNIKGTASFNEKYADQDSKGYGLSFASASPAQDADGVTNVEMKLGESKTFEFTVDDKLDSWLDQSEPRVIPSIEVGASDISKFHVVRKGVQSYTFTPEETGYYLVYMGAHLQLGYNYDTKVGIAHYYTVHVTEPDATPEPPEPEDDGYIGAISAAQLTIPEPYVAYDTPSEGMELPTEEDGLGVICNSSANPNVASTSAQWYRKTDSGWKACSDLGDTQFEGGNSYQLRVEFVAEDGHYFKDNLHGVGFTTLTIADELEGPAEFIGHGSKRTSVAWNKSYLPVHEAAGAVDRVSFAVREFTVEGESAAEPPSESDKTSYVKPDGTPAIAEFVEIDGSWHYFDADGTMVAGWQTIDGKLYYFDGKGVLVSSKNGVTALSKGAVKVSNAVYTGKALKPAPQVTLYGRTLKAGTDYTIAYKNNVNAGTATLAVKGAGSFSGSLSQTFKIAKATPTIKAKKQTVAVSHAKVKKKAQGVANLTVKCDSGKASYKNASSNKTAKKFKVNAKTGKVTVPKGTKKATYTVKVKVTVKAGANYKKLAKTVSFKVKVK